MKVKTIVKFKDLKANKVRKVGEVFEIDSKRLEKLNSNTFGPLVEVVKDNKIKGVDKQDE